MLFSHLSFRWLVVMLIGCLQLSVYCQSHSPQLCSFYDGQVLARKAQPGQWQWHPLAVGGGGQNIGVTFDPHHPQNIYVRVDVSGVIKSTDYGEHWRNVNMGFHGYADGNYGVGALAVDPHHPDRLYASVGRTFHPAGFFRSDDAGETWSRISTDVIVYGEAAPEPRKYGGPGILIHPVKQGLFYSINHKTNNGAGGVWQSVDQGVHWQPTGLDHVRTTTIRFEPNNPNHLWASSIRFKDNPGGMYSSLDAGRTWQAMGLQDQDVYDFVFAPDDVKTIYAVSALAGVYKTTDAGLHWQPVNEGLPLDADGKKGQFFKYDYHGITINPRDPSHLLVVADVIQAIFQTHDAGRTWQRIKPVKINVPDGWMLSTRHLAWNSNQILFHPDDPNMIFLTDFWGTWRSVDQGKTWEIHPYGQESSCMVSCLPDVGIAQRLYLGIWDHNLLIYQDDDHKPMTRRTEKMVHRVVSNTNSHVSSITQNAAHPQQMLCVSNSTVLQTSRDRGLNWEAVTSEAFPDDVTFRVGQPLFASAIDLAFLPINGRVEQGGGVYCSRDAGVTWRKQTNGGLDIAVNVTRRWGPHSQKFAVSADGNMMLLASDGKLFFSTNQAESWQPIDTLVPVACLLIDPANPQRLVIGADRDQTGSLYVSQDAGRTWQMMSGIDGQVISLAMDPHDSTRLLCHTQQQDADDPSRLIYRLMLSEDGGARWQNLLNPSIGLWRLTGIAFDPFDRDRIYANSYWAGSWVAHRPE